MASADKQTSVISSEPLNDQPTRQSHLHFTVPSLSSRLPISSATLPHQTPSMTAPEQSRPIGATEATQSAAVAQPQPELEAPVVEQQTTETAQPEAGSSTQPDIQVFSAPSGSTSAPKTPCKSPIEAGIGVLLYCDADESCSRGGRDFLRAFIIRRSVVSRHCGFPVQATE